MKIQSIQIQRHSKNPVLEYSQRMDVLAANIRNLFYKVANLQILAFASACCKSNGMQKFGDDKSAKEHPKQEIFYFFIICCVKISTFEYILSRNGFEVCVWSMIEPQIHAVKTLTDHCSKN